MPEERELDIAAGVFQLIEGFRALRARMDEQRPLLERIDRQQREIIDRQRRSERALRLGDVEAVGSGD